MRLRHRYRRRWQRSPRRRIHVVRQELSAQRVVNLLLDVRHLAVVHAGDAFQVVIIKFFGFPEGERETVLNARITT